MISPDNEKQRIIIEFQRRERKQIILTIILLPIIIVFVIVCHKANLLPCPLGFIFVLLCTFIFLPAAIFSFINYRCPACNAFLLKSINPGFCYKCKAQLREKVNIMPSESEREKAGFLTFNHEEVRYQLQIIKPKIIIILVGIVFGILMFLFK